MPLVSIIIPTYNRSSFLIKTIDSVLSQNFSDFEVIVIDDGSTDDTSYIVSSILDPRIIYIKIPHSGLPAIARNVGLKKASGKYIAFLDSDDIWMFDKLKKQLKILEQEKGFNAVCSNAMVLGHAKKKVLKIIKNKILTIEDQLVESKIINSSVMMRSELLAKVGYLDESVYLKASEDYDFWLKILHNKNKSILLLKDPLLYYRRHDSGLSSINITNPALLEERLKIILLKYYSIYPSIVDKAFRKNKSETIYIDICRRYDEGVVTFLDLLLQKNLNVAQKMKIFFKKYNFKSN